MREFVSANETLRADDAATVQAAIALAAAEGCRKAVIPRRNARTGESLWVFDRAVELPSDFTLILDNCVVRQGLASYENLFTNERSYDLDYINRPENRSHDIAILGEGNTILDGGAQNMLREKTKGQFGLPASCHKNSLCRWWHVDGLRLENVHLRNPRYWALVHLFCHRVTLKNINFQAEPHIPNLDGIDLRVGCQDFYIENITGRTGDDSVALNAMSSKAAQKEYPAEWTPHICHIKMRNLKCDSNTCFLLRLLNHDGNEIFDIDADTLYDACDPAEGLLKKAAVSIGSPFYWNQWAAKPGDTRDIRIRHVTSSGTNALVLNRVLRDCEIDDVKTFGGSVNGVSTVGEGLLAENVTVRHFFYGPERPQGPAGTAVNLTNMQGEMRLEHLQAAGAAVGLAASGGIRVSVSDAVWENIPEKLRTDGISSVEEEVYHG